MQNSISDNSSDALLLARSNPPPSLPARALSVAPQTVRDGAPNAVRPPLLPNALHPRAPPPALPPARALARRPPQMRRHDLRPRQPLHGPRQTLARPPGAGVPDDERRGAVDEGERVRGVWGVSEFGVGFADGGGGGGVGEGAAGSAERGCAPFSFFVLFRCRSFCFVVFRDEGTSSDPRVEIFAQISVQNLFFSFLGAG